MNVKAEVTAAKSQSQLQGLIEANLGAWCEDIVAWVGDCVWGLSPLDDQPAPVRLAEHQVKWLREATRRNAAGDWVHKTCVACWP